MPPNAIDFVSNDFLGFSRSSVLFDMVEERYRAYCQVSESKLGATGSRRILGTSSLVSAVEDKICAYHGVEEAFVVHSGYMANMGLCSHLTEESDVLLWDEGVHTSVSHSLPLIKGRQHAFRHNDMEHLEALLAHYRQATSGRLFIFVCSMYSFRGTCAPLEELLFLSRKYHAQLVVDEAHAMGIFGQKGRGLCAQWGYENFYAIVVTYSKALGCVGAAILSSVEVKGTLMKTAVPLLYTTGMPPHNLISISAAYDLLSTEGEIAREKLRSLQKYYSSVHTPSFSGCVQPIYLKDGELDYLRPLLEREQIRVGEIVSVEPAYIRVNLHAYNTYSEIDTFVRVLQELSSSVLV